MPLNLTSRKVKFVTVIESKNDGVISKNKKESKFIRTN